MTEIRVSITLTEQQARMVLRTEPWIAAQGSRHSVPLEMAEAVIKTAVRNALERHRDASSDG